MSILNQRRKYIDVSLKRNEKKSKMVEIKKQMRLFQSLATSCVLNSVFVCLFVFSF